MADPLSLVNDLLAPVFADIAGAPADPVVRPSDRADAQVNGALPLAKQLGTNPREIAQRVVDSGALQTVCTDVEIAGPGFINLTFDDAFLAAELGAIAVGDRLGIVADPHPRTVVIDYSAPNVAKEMHAGHLRTTVIGDALVRMLEFAGHTVIRENHIGDWGRPFGMLIEHLLDIGEDVAAEGMQQGDLDGFYKAANAKFADDEEFQARSRDRVVKLQSYDPETIALWERLVEMSTAYFNQVYDKLDVLLTDDDLMGESVYQPKMQETIDRLRSAELLEESDGATVVFPPGFTNRDNEPLPLIVQARTGGFNYATSDLTCVIDRVERLGADLLLYVVGAPQAQHLQMVFEVAKMAGWLEPPAEAVHVSFGSVLGEDRKMLRSRSGDAVKLVELLDEAVERAAAAVAEKNPDLDDAERDEVARTIGIGAVKYADLSTDRIKDYVFDWDRMLAFEGNTAPYLQYAHARICSIFRRAEVDRTSVRSTEIALGEPPERELAKRLLAYPSALDDTLATYSPHKLCTYLFDLAQDFMSFYEHCPVMKADEPVRSSRLALSDLTARTLEHGLGLLGITAPEAM
ncbi:arginyl-tRNA synthetase [Ilumatobacter fluminis]|uniref:Arginine--tRNA ligase n=1 Tax=Ilumatobacter fluminis TaxID=467091 RepID=A0A4R7HYY0_9ACTN|nr:arginine--tRNA ligase [Ilumatobacter fluminis]TDT15456.1 arginyl-tRNA synthetase [Ilumatobacter fluminis]